MDIIKLVVKRRIWRGQDICRTNKQSNAEYAKRKNIKLFKFYDSKRKEKMLLAKIF